VALRQVTALRKRRKTTAMTSSEASIACSTKVSYIIGSSNKYTNVELNYDTQAEERESQTLRKM
jgi:hypothetical protein